MALTMLEGGIGCCQAARRTARRLPWRDYHQGNAQSGYSGHRESLRAIAEGLNQRQIPTAKGGRWSATQVMRVLDRQ